MLCGGNINENHNHSDIWVSKDFESNKLGAPRMTMELLHSRDPADEVIGWLRDISKFIQA